MRTVLHQKKMTDIRSALKSVEIEPLEKLSCSFFNRFGKSAFLGDRFCNAEALNGTDLFSDFIKVFGFEKDPAGFFSTLLRQIDLNPGPDGIVLNQKRVSHLYLLHLLEQIWPSNRLFTIKTVTQLERQTGITVTETDRDEMQRVIEQYPVRLSGHVIRQALVSGHVAAQYIPSVRELDPAGDRITFNGHLKKGILEQMYENRVVFLLDMKCPVYCRFCFRKHKKDRTGPTPSKQEIRNAVGHVRKNPAIKEILITGGEPMINRSNLEFALDELSRIKHIRIVRLATRSVSYFPELFLRNNRELIRYLIQMNDTYRRIGKRIEIGLHFVHPDEVSIQSLEIITEIVKRGVQVYLQTPFLKGINSEGQTLGRLFTLLRNVGVKIYYIFTPCSPIHGTRSYWTAIKTAVEAYHYLNQNLSDRSIPKLCTATPLGKIEWGSSGWAVEPDERDPSYTWIRTPYTQPYYQGFIEDEARMPVFRSNPEGTLDARFRVRMGDDTLIKGHRPRRLELSGRPHVPVDKKQVLEHLASMSGLRPSTTPVPSNKISRIHPAVVEMAAGAGKKELAYLRVEHRITDVILCPGRASFNAFDRLSSLILQLREIKSIRCIRLAMPWFVHYPEDISQDAVNRFTELSDFSIENPFRIEIAVQFLDAEDIATRHDEAVALLLKNGINIYADIPLIQGINDDPEIILSLANRLRKAGIEFHRIYTGGLSLQKVYNREWGIPSETLIDIASKLRTDCSGRQLPLYVRLTQQGEKLVDMTDGFTA